MKASSLATFAAVFVVSISARAATFTVINTNVTGAGSLQQAIFDANANAGADVITFNIATGGLTITPTNALPNITDPVTIDGSTQPGFAGVPIIELNGTSAGAAVDGLRIATSNTVIRALVINRFLGDGIEITNGANNTVEGCYLGLNLAGLTDQGNSLNGILLTNAANNTIGGLTAASRNYIAGNNQNGVLLNGVLSTNNVLLGNYIGLNTNNADIGNSADGVNINAPANRIGGSVSGARNIISGNNSQGIEITALGANTVVRGNYIGTDGTGTLARGNSADGLWVGAGGVIIGGSNAGEGNLISGNAGDGIELNGLSATNNLILGNIIGANPAGNAGLANASGVLITTSSRSNIVGGVTAGAANLIAFNTGDGIGVAAANANTNNTFRGNSIFSNGNLGIDLGASGILANDAGDADLGANQSQNFPVLTAATNTISGTVIVGTLNSRPDTTYTIDFYASILPNPLGSGEGQTYLGATTLNTDGTGNGSFTASFPVVALAGRYISATATDNFGNTSEFATNTVVVATLPGSTFTVVNTNDSGPGSLRQAIIGVNAVATVGDRIEFAITNLGTTISPASALPVIADPVTIDGYTQPGAVANTSPLAFNGVVPVRLAGTSAGSGANGLVLAGGNSTVRGLTITGFNSDGIEISGFGGNVVAGCVIGLDAAGADQGNTANGVFISGSSNNIVGGLALAARNVISGNNSDGVEISGVLARNNQILNNLIGPDQTGTLDRGNNADGIFITQAGGNIIGGSETGSGNLISGNNSDGIELNGISATNNLVLGNLIGTAPGGVTGLPNTANGVLITASSRSNIVGGVLPGQANVIAFNSADGISVAAAVANTNNTFRGNAIFSNGNLGIDLGASGVTLNDAGDADTGANQLQNFPVLSFVTNTPAGTTISGALNSRPDTTYTIDFYANVSPNALGYGEGQTYLGSTSLTTDETGDGGFTVLLPVVTLAGRHISATATDNFGNTSEFAANVSAASTLPGLTLTVVNTNDSGPGSLRQAILAANAAITAGDTIAFAITNLITTIAPASALPAITDPVTIDGYTQPGAAANTAADGFNGVLPVRLAGNSAGSGVNGLLITGGGSTVRGLMITGFNGDGVELSGLGGNVIEGCLIGIDAAGTDQGNNANGVYIIGSADNLVGGVTPTARNVISGNNSDGIEISGASATGNLVLGNIIGANLSGATALANSGNGVLITTSSRSNTVGGVLPGQANVIAFNGADGISVAAAVANTNNTFRGNSIFSNGDLGIDLGASGVTLNDAGDVDAGANQLQNFPVLSTATNSPTHVGLSGSLASAANTSYMLDFYANLTLDLSGYGEGQTYLGSVNVTTDGGGQADFATVFATALPGRYISATATDPFGNTSEFSRWAVSTTPATNVITGATADFVFIIDASVSMSDEIAAVKNGLGSFVTSLNTNNINARFAVVLFGGPTEIIQDFTSDQATTEAAFDVISVNGAVTGVHNNHNLNPEAGLEAIRIVLNAATNNTLQRNNVGGSGPLAFRPEARKNLILVTDENSDLPYYAENRESGQTGTEPPGTLTAPWQAEINTTAQAVIAHNAFINLLIAPSGVIRNQYGDPAQSVSDANFLNYNPEATLTNLINAGFGNSLEAQVLAAGLVGRAFNIGSVNTTNFIANFFAAKVEEITSNPIPPPRLNIVSLPPDAVRLTWTTNSFGYVLQTNHNVALPNGWGVLTTNYSVIGTNYVVTNTVNDTTRFYRLHK